MNFCVPTSHLQVLGKNVRSQCPASESEWVETSPQEYLL